jgi:hypothetical protein
MGFVSHVIAGELHSTHYERAADDDERAESFEELRVAGPALSDFANNATGLEAGSLVRLRLVDRKSHRAGQTYRFPSGGIHRVDTPHSLTSPVITLTVWEPAFQPSLAYQPAVAKTHAGPMAVRRLTLETYDHVIRLVVEATTPASAT